MASNVKPMDVYTSSLSPEEQVFQNRLTVGLIMKHSRPRDLCRHLRLVNSACEAEATSLLQKLPPQILSIDFHFQQLQYTYTIPSNIRRKVSYGKTLQELNDLLETSYNFPCPNFSFHGGHVDHPHLQRFLTLNGFDIKFIHLDIPLDTSPGNYPTFSSFVSANLPNVTQVSIDHLPSQWFLQTLTSTATNPILPSIETVDLNVGPCDDPSKRSLVKLTSELLTSCVNLQSFKNFNFPDLQEFLPTNSGRSGVIKEFTLVGIHTDEDETPGQEPDAEIIQELGQSYLDILASYVKTEPRLVNIVVEGSPRRSKTLAGLWQRILSSSHSTLQELSIIANQNLTWIFPPNFVFQNVKKLRMRDFLVPVYPPLASHHFAFSSGVELCRNFPNVNRLELILYNDDEDFMEIARRCEREKIPSMPSVEELRIVGAKWPLKMTLGHLMRYINNLRKIYLEVTTEYVVKRDFENLFEWRALEQIELVLVANGKDFEQEGEDLYEGDGMGHTFPVLDSVLTGMREEECKRLREDDGGDGNVSGKMEVSREGRKFIGHLKELRSLKIQLRDGREMDGMRTSRRHYFPLSWIASVYGFQTLPLLSVSVIVESISFGTGIEDTDYDYLINLSEYFEIIN